MIQGLRTEWRAFLFGARKAFPYIREEQLYILMKRLRQPYSELINMPLKVRDYMLKREIDLMEEENRKANPNKL